MEYQMKMCQENPALHLEYDKRSYRENPKKKMGLSKNGYTNFRITFKGYQAWNLFKSTKKFGQQEKKTGCDKVANFLQQVKQNPIIFSQYAIKASIDAASDHFNLKNISFLL